MAIAIAFDANAAAELPRESDVSGKKRLVVCIPSDVTSLDPTNHRRNRIGNFVPPATGMMDLRDVYLK